MLEVHHSHAFHPAGIVGRIEADACFRVGVIVLVGAERDAVKAEVLEHYGADPWITCAVDPEGVGVPVGVFNPDAAGARVDLVPARCVAGVVADAQRGEAMARSTDGQEADVHIHPGLEGIVSRRDVDHGTGLGRLAGLLALDVSDDAVDDEPDVVVRGGGRIPWNAPGGDVKDGCKSLFSSHRWGTELCCFSSSASGTAGAVLCMLARASLRRMLPHASGGSGWFYRRVLYGRLLYRTPIRWRCPCG